MSFRPSYVQEQLKGNSAYKRLPSRPKTIPPAKFTRDNNYIEITKSANEWKCRVHTDYGTYIGYTSESYTNCWNWRENKGEYYV